MKFIKDSVNQLTWWSLGTRAGARSSRRQLLIHHQLSWPTCCIIDLPVTWSGISLIIDRQV